MYSRRQIAVVIVLVTGLAIWITHVSVPGGAPNGCAAECRRGEAPSPGPLRILTFNVWHDFPKHRHLARRLDHLASELERLDVDVACLQETPGTWRLGNTARHVAESTGMNHVFFRANGNRRAILFEEGVAVLSRFPILDSVGIALPPKAGFFENRVALHARLQTPRTVLDVVCTHLARDREEAHGPQVDALVAYVEAQTRHPTVIVGDFNARPDGPSMVFVPPTWIDTYAVANDSQPAMTCCLDKGGFDGSTRVRKRVDYVFVRLQRDEPAAILSSRIVLNAPFDDGLWPSDHFGVLSEIEL